METRVALIGIIVENSESTAQLNALLHDADDADALGAVGQASSASCSTRRRT